ncbi:MAG: DUF1559 domain-containing protein, partial [Pirellulales bacterium]
PCVSLGIFSFTHLKVRRPLFLILWPCGLAMLVAPIGPVSRQSPWRSNCAIQLRQIGLALQHYHDRYGSFPPAYVPDAAGKPMHSWRVLILPYLGHKRLYARYNFNEPWNGPNNRLLAKGIAEIFRCPSDDPAKPAETSYVAVVGPRTLWPGDASIAYDDIPDSPEDTVLVIEMADSGIHWMEPRDLDASALKLAPTRGQAGDIDSGHPGGPQALMADCSVRTISRNTNEQSLEALFTRDDGKPTDSP